MEKWLYQAIYSRIGKDGVFFSDLYGRRHMPPFCLTAKAAAAILPHGLLLCACCPFVS
jgi:hypothetical protein